MALLETGVERGAATKGRVAKAMAGAEAIEIKATVPDRQIGTALRRFGLTADNDQERFIYFFDTPKLELLEAGIIARARRVVGQQHDSTVKFRPIEPKSVDAEWRKFPDFKIEADASETSMVKSASFSMPVERGQIKRIVAGKRPISRIFTPEQERFIVKTAGHKIDFDKLVVLGPLQAQRWRFIDPGCPWPITAELWKRGDGKRMMELSIKAPAAQAAVAVAGFMAFLAEVGAERDTEQKTKTRWALDYYVSKLAQDAAQPAIKAVAPRRRVTKKAPAAAGGTTTPRKQRSPSGATVPAKAGKPAAAPVPSRRPAAKFRKRAAKRR
jgi:hypothetical protein